MDDAPLLALDHLRRTSPKRLAKAAVQELVRRDVLRLQPFVLPDRRRAAPRPGLTDGPAPLPSGALLLLVARTVRATPTTVTEGRAVRDLRRAAQRLSGLGHELADAALADLAAAGLAERQARRLLGLVTVTTWRRTPAGDEELARRRSRGASSGSEDGRADGSTGAGVVVSGPHGHDVRGDDVRGDELPGDLDTSFDGSFDSSFDASFDSGFSGGDGGGGGDSGGGGGGD